MSSKSSSPTATSSLQKVDSAKSSRKTRSQSSLSMNSLMKTKSLTNLFKTRSSKKRQRSPESDEYDDDSIIESPKTKLLKTRSTAEEEAFRAKEKEYDEELPPEYRSFRPKGFRFNIPPTDRPVRIYADGVFDLFHLGHMRQLEQCKKSFPNVELVVGIPNDKETHARKGLTVLSDQQRYDTVRHCRWVDEVVEDAPWILNMDFLKEHNIDYCAHDDLPYVADGIDDIYKPMKEHGMFLATQRTEGISTSDIITKIIRDYDKYLMRNFARGATRKELNVSWLKKNELDLKKQISDFRSSWKKTNSQLSTRSRDLYFLVRESLRGNAINRRVETPVDRFAAKYNGNGLHRTNSKRSLLDNLKGFVGIDSHSEFENNTTDFDEYYDSEENGDGNSPTTSTAPTSTSTSTKPNSDTDTDNGSVQKIKVVTPSPPIIATPSRKKLPSNISKTKSATASPRKSPKKRKTVRSSTTKTQRKA